ncbi:MAG: hypothetical protein NVS3B21_00350 [Acidimicrobiales bacterium]
MATIPGRRLAVGVSAVAGAWLLAAALLPAGLAPGVVLQGVVLGGLQSLTAMGLVLVYRSTRVINFAQAEIGALAASVAVVMVTGFRLPYGVGVAAGLAVAVATGAVVERIVVRRFFTAPRLILTVATIGVVQLIGAAEIFLPQQFGQLKPLSTFRTPFRLHFVVRPQTFRGDHLVALVVVGVVLAGLATFLGRSGTGIAVRAAADSSERAQLLGVPVRRLSLITWSLAAALSGIGSILSAPILGPNLGSFSGPRILLLPLAAAVIARMESLWIAVVAAVLLSVVQQAVFASYLRSSAVDIVFFVVVLGGLLLQRRRVTRVDDGDLGGFVAVREVRPVPAALGQLGMVRAARAGIAGLVVAACIILPLVVSNARATLIGYMAIYGIIAVSLVVLTGWAGQISLGHFAFVGVGASATAALLVHHHSDLWVALVGSAAVGAAVATLIGIPALRIPGPFLAVATLAFAVPVSTYLLNSTHFPLLTPAYVARPAVFDRFDMGRPVVFAYTCLAVCAVALALARNFRRSRVGRTVLAVRDNERNAAAFGINAVRAKLTAFAFSGALAGVAGGLYVVGLQGLGYNSFPLPSSIVVFSMVVVGGLGSLPGALLGAIYVEGAEFFLHGALQLVATGGGLLVLLMVLPGGIGEILFSLRDRALRRLAVARGLDLPAFGTAALSAHSPAATSGRSPADAAHDIAIPGPGVLVRCEGIDAGYGPIQILFDVDLDVARAETVALLGTNGAGKSTLLRVIGGLIEPSAGRVWWDGEDITSWSPGDRVRAGLATVPGGRGVFGSLTVEDNLRVATWLTGRDAEFVERTTARIFEWFPRLAERRDVRAAMLSGGEQQMLAISQAMLCRPRLLMIDELSLGLAPAVVALLLDTVKRLNADGVTVIVVEQSVNVATALAQRAVFMEKGQIRFSGATAELAERPDLLRAVFLNAEATRVGPASTAGPGGAHLFGSSDQPAPAPVGFAIGGLRRRFGGVVAIDDVSLTVAPGEVVGVIGSNGAGKTTLFDLCSGFLTPDAGTIHLGTHDLTHMSADERGVLGLGRVFQDARLFPSLTVSETIATAFDRHVDVRDPLACIFRVGATVESEAAVRTEVNDLLEILGLGRWRDSFIAELSTGTRRMVELACALAHRPSVLLLDEPSSGIAQRETEALGGVLLDIRRELGATLVVIEHDIPMITGIADRLVCLHLGGIIAEGMPQDVLHHPAVVASYLGTDDVAIERSGRRPARTKAKVRAQRVVQDAADVPAGIGR